MTQTYFSDMLEFLFRPYPPDRIVRGTDQKQLYGALNNLLFQIGKIDFVPSVIEKKLGYDKSAVIFRNDLCKLLIDRLTDQYGVARIGQRYYGCSNCKHHAGRFQYPFGTDFPFHSLCIP